MSNLLTENEYFAPIYCVNSIEKDLKNQYNVALCVRQTNTFEFDLKVKNFVQFITLGELDPKTLGELDILTLYQMTYK